VSTSITLSFQLTLCLLKFTPAIINNQDPKLCTTKAQFSYGTIVKVNSISRDLATSIPLFVEIFLPSLSYGKVLTNFNITQVKPRKLVVGETKPFVVQKTLSNVTEAGPFERQIDTAMHFPEIDP
jgi:hypothetical protein